MQVVLVMFRGEGERRSFSIARDVTVIGRREDCDFRIPLGEISRKHCRLVKDGEALRVEDLGSSNGTCHNGERVQAAFLQPGDTLQVGSVAFVVQIDGAPADDDMAPVTAGQRRTAAPADADDAPDATLADAGAPTMRGNGHEHATAGAGNGNGHRNGEFDPMTVLEAEGSGALPAIDDSQIHNDQIMLDLAENNEAGNAPADHA